jgi:glycosyltransferase involved in cell wall biosynthesis
MMRVGKKLRVAVMLTPVEFGGAERVCLTLLKHIDREAFDVVPILFTRPWERENVFTRLLEDHRYPIVEIPVARKLTGDYLRILRCYRLAWRILARGGFDLIHTHGYFADIIGIPIARLVGLPSISTCHGYIPSTWHLRVYNALDRFALRFGSRVLAVSETMKAALIASGLRAERIAVLVNAVDRPEDCPDGRDELPESPRRRLGLAAGEFAVTFVGRLSPEKGVNHLLAASEVLVRNGVPLRVLVVGDGPQRHELQRLSQHLGLGDRCIFAGFQENIAPWLRDSDVFVLPSLTEGTPMALLEAMASGIPAIASAVGGVPKLITHGETGLLISPGSEQELAAALLALFRDSTLRKRLARDARALVRARFGTGEWIARVEAEYRNISK